MLTERWRIEMLGGLRLVQPSHTTIRFQTRKTGLLLAYLAFYSNRIHSREELVEQLWPEADPDAGRANLRVALVSLRRQLEPPGTPSGYVLIADRSNIHLSPEAFITDIAEFEAALQAAERQEAASERERLLARAIELYHGDLLPGCYDEWVLLERHRLSGAFAGALRQLVILCEAEGHSDCAIQYAHQALSADPYQEEIYHYLIRLYMATGQPVVALHQYHELERMLDQQFGQSPSPAIRSLVAGLQKREGRSAEVRKQRPTKVVPTAPPEPPQKEQASSTIHLPLPLTRFFGREEEIARLSKWIQSGETRLIVLAGVGGAGKTRLAIELARTGAPSFQGVICFTPLTSLSEGSQVYDAILAALHLQRSPSLEPKTQVIDHLRRQPSLLILDNFEHLVSSGAGIVWSLLQELPLLTCLVTSRQRLYLEGEQEFTVSPLAVPEEPDLPERLMQFPGVRLFVDRAQLARPNFQITPGNAAAVANICACLEGIPLAIELAAARAQALTPTQMLSQLEDRFDFLVSRRQKTGDRHRSLQAVLDWSYGLLASPLQHFFVKLSVFRGGWTAKATEEVCEEPMATEYLEQLRARSLVVLEEGEPEMRYRLLETVREYAQEQLMPEERPALARRHADYFCYFAEETIEGPDQAQWLDRLETEHDNLRTVIQWSLDCGIEIGLRLTAALWRFWLARGYTTEGRRWLQEVLQRSQEIVTFERARVLNAAASLAASQTDLTAARPLYEQCLDLLDRLGNEHGKVRIMPNLGIVLRVQGEYSQARAIFQKVLSDAQQNGDRPTIALALSNLGHVASALEEDTASCRSLHEQALQLYEELDDKANVGITLSYLAECELALGNYESAWQLAEESMKIEREVNNRPGIATVLYLQGEIAYRQADYVLAQCYYKECLRLHNELGEKGSMTDCLTVLASTRYHLGSDTAEAVTLYGAEEALRQDLRMPIRPRDQKRRDSILQAAREKLGQEAYEVAWAAGQAMSLEEAVAYALKQADAKDTGCLPSSSDPLVTKRPSKALRILVP